MKKITAFCLSFFLFICSTVSVYADENKYKFIDDYNITATVLGAPEIDAGKMQYSKENVDYTVVNGVTIIFQFSELGGVKNIAVCTSDDNTAADFICTCTAVITYFGELDLTAYGMLLYQYSSVRAGNEFYPYNLGVDAFGISSNDQYKYLFVYMNNDLSENK